MLTCGLLAVPPDGEASSRTEVTVAAVIRAVDECKISTGSPELDFGSIDPRNPVDVRARSSLVLVCKGNTGQISYSVTDDGGMYGYGDNMRMRHSAISTEYIPYSLSYSPQAGTINSGIVQTLTITGSLSGNDYRSVDAGDYGDSVIVTISP